MMRVGAAGCEAARVVALSRAHGVSTMTHDDTMATMNALRADGFIVAIVFIVPFVWEIVIMFVP